jgi:hypothetical protein
MIPFGVINLQMMGAEYFCCGALNKRAAVTQWRVGSTGINGVNAESWCGAINSGGWQANTRWRPENSLFKEKTGFKNF